MDYSHAPTAAGGRLTRWVWWRHHQRSPEMATSARGHETRRGLHREHLHIARNSLEVISRGGGRPRQLAAVRLVLRSSMSTTRGYKGRPAMWTSKTDVLRCPQALCGVAVVQWSVEQRRGEYGNELGFWHCFAEDLGKGSTIYRDFCTIS
jgi:hypothetical protein